MPVVIAMFRAVNVGGRQVKKDTLIAIHKAVGCMEPETLITSGNVVFTTRVRKLDELAKRIEEEFERAAGFRSEAILRTHDELCDAVTRNPFAGRAGIDPSRLLIHFLATRPSKAAIAATMAMDVAPEEMHVAGREMYVHYPNGLGRSKFPAVKVGKALGGIASTGRNLNTVIRLMEIAAARG